MGLLTAFILVLPVVLKKQLCNYGVTDACDNSELVTSVLSASPEDVQHALQHTACSPYLLDTETGMSPFHIACMSGDDSSINLMLQHQLPPLRRGRPDFDVPTAIGQTCMALAAEHGHLPLVQALSRLGVDMNIATSDGNTPLMLSLRRQHTDVARFLITSGADVNRVAQGIAKGTPVAGARLNQHENSALLYPVTALQIAVKQHDQDAISALLLRRADANLANDLGVTALMLAAAGDDAAAIRLLVNHGANMETEAAGGFRAIAFAIWHKREQALKELLKAGATLNFNVHNRQSTMHLAAKTESPSILRTVLEAADSELVDIADVHGMTPLMHACSARFLEGMRMLLEHGADINARNRAGFTCAMNVASGMPKKLLLEPEARAFVDFLQAGGADLNARSSADFPVIYFALISDQPHYAAALLRAGVDYKSPLTGGKSIATLAADKQAQAALDVLRQLTAA